MKSVGWILGVTGLVAFCTIAELLNLDGGVRQGLLVFIAAFVAMAWLGGSVAIDWFRRRRMTINQRPGFPVSPCERQGRRLG